ncbi:hypothetical protein B296_00040363 [Ensete ventricosum]|uniref:Uncharacterized protein n=1 Tax=Ensete ventricosum TaxID=4639 RepID=A0A426WW18_ENSVE|nr:hypothetical protein B296_00040363 [Ensete ventricosum]
MARPLAVAVGHGQAPYSGGRLRPRPYTGSNHLLGKPPVGAAAYSAASIRATTCNTVPTDSDGRLRAQRPWAGLQTRWLHEVVLPACRGCRPRAAMPSRGQRRRRHNKGEGGLRHLFRKRWLCPSEF